MPPEFVAPSQQLATVMTLSPMLRTLAALLSIIFKGSLYALRDTALSQILAWALNNPSLLESYAPTRLNSVIIHFCFFLFGQSSWRAAAITMRSFASRDDADDDMAGKLLVESFDLLSYIFMSVLCRNIGIVWRASVWAFLYLWYFLQFMGLFTALWMVLVDNPVQTFYAEASNVWNTIYPKLVSSIHRLGAFIATLLRYAIRMTTFVLQQMMARGKRTATTRAATLGVYHYSTLEPGAVRLLKLSKPTPWSSVKCKLEPVHLNRTPAFETISYTWGANQTSRSLIVNGKRFEVSQKVYDIVHDRASCLTTRYVWIDSICINQEDDAEKSSQVQMMRSIYGLSYHTIIWLGSAPDANEAIGLLAHLHRRIQFDDPIERASRPLMELNIEHPSWPSLIKLINNDYWTRCWIIQEIAVSQKTIISYGGELITWDYFCSLIETLFGSDPNSVWHISKIFWRNRTSQETIPMDAGIQIVSLKHIRENIRKNRSMELFDLLTASINSTATDPRDNIYSVHGISTAVSSGDIIPDYTTSVEDSFLKAARYLLRQDYPARMLHLAGIGFHRNSKLEISWVPDWSTRRLARIYWRNPAETPYYASGSLLENVHMALDFTNSNLILEGFKVDHVKKLGPQFFGISKNGVPRADPFPGIFKDYKDCRDMIMDGALKEPYVTGIPLIEAFWRTLIGDRTPEDTRPAAAAFFEYYLALEKFTEALIEMYGTQMNSLNSDVSIEEQTRLGNSIGNYATDMGRFANVMGPYTRERMFAITERGYMGFVPPYSKIGDLVFIVCGAQVPFLLRYQAGVRAKAPGKWQLVGESYFHGMMDGEMVTESQARQKVELC